MKLQTTLLNFANEIKITFFRN